MGDPSVTVTEALRIAVVLEREKNRTHWLMKRDRDPKWKLRVSTGKVFRNVEGDEIGLDARDVMGRDWYVVDDNGEEVTSI